MNNNLETHSPYAVYQLTFPNGSYALGVEDKHDIEFSTYTEGISQRNQDINFFDLEDQQLFNREIQSATRPNNIISCICYCLVLVYTTYYIISAIWPTIHDALDIKLISDVTPNSILLWALFIIPAILISTLKIVPCLYSTNNSN